MEQRTRKEDEWEHGSTSVRYLVAVELDMTEMTR